MDITPAAPAPRNVRVNPASLPDDLQEAYALWELAMETEDSNGDTATARKAANDRREQVAKLRAGGYQVLGSGKLIRLAD